MSAFLANRDWFRLVQTGDGRRNLRNQGITSIAVNLESFGSLFILFKVFIFSILLIACEA